MPEPRREIEKQREIKITVPPDNSHKWRIALTLSGSALLPTALFALSQYLTARGLVSVALARILLLIAGLCLIAMAFLVVKAFKLPHARSLIVSASTLIIACFGGLEAWATYRTVEAQLPEEITLKAPNIISLNSLDNLVLFNGASDKVLVLDVQINLDYPNVAKTYEVNSEIESRQFKTLPLHQPTTDFVVYIRTHKLVDWKTDYDALLKINGVCLTTVFFDGNNSRLKMIRNAYSRDNLLPFSRKANGDIHYRFARDQNTRYESFDLTVLLASWNNCGLALHKDGVQVQVP
jgi:hypothetical protein